MGAMMAVRLSQGIAARLQRHYALETYVRERYSCRNAIMPVKDPTTCFGPRPTLAWKVRRMVTEERAADGAEEHGMDPSTLGLKERQTWDRQETFLAAYADAGSIRKAAPAAQISREAVRIWQRDDILRFRQRIEHAQHDFREMLQDKALELVKELKPGQNSLLLITMLNAHWPEKYRPNVTAADDTAKDLIAEIKKLSKQQRERRQTDASTSDGVDAPNDAVAEVEEMLRRRSTGR